eukprot:6924037-Heterocapsa_arctica.AAC.1
MVYSHPLRTTLNSAKGLHIYVKIEITVNWFLHSAKGLHICVENEITVNWWLISAKCLHIVVNRARLLDHKM